MDRIVTASRVDGFTVRNSEVASTFFFNEDSSNRKGLIDQRRGIDWKGHQILTGSGTVAWNVHSGSTAFFNLSGTTTISEPTNFLRGEEIRLLVRANGNTLTMSWVDSWLNGPFAAEDTNLVMYHFLKYFDGTVDKIIGWTEATQTTLTYTYTEVDSGVESISGGALSEPGYPYPIGSVNDILIIACYDGSTQSFSTPTGFTAGPSVTSGSYKLQTFFRIYIGTEGSYIQHLLSGFGSHGAAAYGLYTVPSLGVPSISQTAATTGLTAPETTLVAGEFAIVVNVEKSSTVMSNPDQGFHSDQKINDTYGAGDIAVQFSAFGATTGTTVDPTVTGGSTGPATAILTFTGS